MARKSASALSGAIGWGIFAVASYIGYTKARAGDFGAEAQKLADEVHKSLGGLGLANWGKPVGGGGNPPAGGGTPIQPANGLAKGDNGTASGFIRGTRYVDYDSGRGLYFVYWYGTVLWYSSQTAAEQGYNALFVTGHV